MTVPTHPMPQTYVLIISVIAELMELAMLAGGVLPRLPGGPYVSAVLCGGLLTILQHRSSFAR